MSSKNAVDPNNPSEATIQSYIVEELRKRLPKSVVASVPNETRGGDWRAVNEQQRKRGMGLYVGFPDLIVMWRGQVVLVEVKAKRGKVTDNQKAAHALLDENGFDVRVLRSREEAIALADEMIAENADLMRIVG